MKSIKKNKLKDELRVTIQNAILTGELKPGDRIIETRIASEAGVSQAPVREALKELEHIGLVESRPYQGTYVNEITPKKLSDAYEARLVLEIYAVEEAAKRISQVQLDCLQQLIEKMNFVASEGDITAFVDYDNEFHATIIQSGGNEMVGKLWNFANISLWTHITANLTKRSLNNLAMRHTEIFEALKEHNVRAAREAIQIHLLELRDEMLKMIKLDYTMGNLEDKF